MGLGFAIRRNPVYRSGGDILKDPPLPDTGSQTYPRAPITEAVIEIRVDTKVGDREQGKVVRRLKSGYPNAQSLQTVNVNIDTTGGQVGLEQHPQGYRLTTDDQADIVLVMPHGVAVARLAPYPGWAALRDRAQTVWETWRRTTPRHALSRLGIRYINRIDVPVDDRPSIRLQDYLSLHPQIPPIGVGPMLGYIMQVTLPTSDPNWTATITSALVTPPPVPNHMSLLLDIDVFRSEAIPVSDDELWSVID